jgi:hypothetical protein
MSKWLVKHSFARRSGVNQQEQDTAVLAWLQGNHPAEAGEVCDEQPVPQPSDDPVDACLRALGYNYRERRTLRQRQPRRVQTEKYHDVTARRFEFYIAAVVPGSTKGQLAELVAKWMKLTSNDLDVAQRWWDAGGLLTWVPSCDFLCASAQGERRCPPFASVGLDGLPDDRESVRDGPGSRRVHTTPGPHTLAGQPAP